MAPPHGQSGPRRWRAAGVAAALAALVAPLLTGCIWMPSSSDRTRHSVYEHEQFQRDETFSRLFDAPTTDTCEAARRALLSQGYVIAADARADAFNANKHFQPKGDVHMVLEFTVVCVPETPAATVATAFVSAQQVRYVIRRNTNTTSLGVGGLGSISVPLSSSEDALVKVGSETVTESSFYDRFFALTQRMLVDLQAVRPLTGTDQAGLAEPAAAGAGASDAVGQDRPRQSAGPAAPSDAATPSAPTVPALR